jgi:hypothetical protein
MLSLIVALGALGSACTEPAQTQHVGDASPPPAAGERDTGTGDVAGLTLPARGDRFTIGEEQWEVVAATVTLPSEGVQVDTQIIDVTIQAKRAAAEPIEYLGQDEEPNAGDTGVEQ